MKSATATLVAPHRSLLPIYIGRYTLALAAVLITFAGLLPHVGLFLAVFSEDSFAVKTFREAFQSPLTQDALTRSLGLGVMTASIAILLALLLHFCLGLLPGKVYPFALGIQCIGLMISPYVFTQGWIGLLGSTGTLREIDSLSTLLAPFSLYTSYGALALLVLQLTPFALLFLELGIRSLSQAESNLDRLLRLSLTQRLRAWELPRYGPIVLLAWIWLFILAFWSYDIPSMLRVHTFSLELLSNFGSFYDYGRALALSLPVMLGSVAIGLLSFAWINRRSQFDTQVEMNHPSSHGYRKKTSPGIYILTLFALSFLPLATLGVPLLGLLAQIESLSALPQHLALFKGDFSTTILVALPSGLLVASATLLYACWLFCDPHQSPRWIIALQLFFLTTPALLGGIGFAWLFSRLPAGGIVDGLPRLVIIQFALWTPLALLLIPSLFSFWRRSWTETAHLLQRPSLVWQIGRRPAAPAFVLLFLIVATLAAREVPASLVNYPPGQSTLSLSIETVLHFDQPAVVASLCLGQLVLAVALWTAGLITIALLRSPTFHPHTMP